MGDRARESETTSAKSGFTGFHFKESVEHEEISSSGFQVAESMSTEWTNEKHSSYLNSMEASFVKQLYNDEFNSMDLLGWTSRRKGMLDPSSYRHLDANTCSSSCQVLQSGSWKKIDFEKAPHQLDGVQHYKVRAPHQDKTLLHHGKSVALCSEATSLGRQFTNSNEVSLLPSRACKDSVCSSEEASGQNFFEEEIKSVQRRRVHRTKRSRTMGPNNLIKDQVVPNGKSPAIGDNEEKYASLDRKPTYTTSEAENNVGVRCP